MHQEGYTHTHRERERETLLLKVMQKVQAHDLQIRVVLVVHQELDDLREARQEVVVSVSCTQQARAKAQEPVKVEKKRHWGGRQEEQRDTCCRPQRGAQQLYILCGADGAAQRAGNDRTRA